MNAPGKIRAVLCVAFSCGFLHAQTPTPLPVDSPSSNSLTTTEAVQKLSPAEAALNRPVRLRGVVTFSQPGWRLLFVEDGTGGIYCETIALTEFPEVGHEVEIDGVSAPGGFLPVVVVGKLRDLGPKLFPSARPTSTTELWKGEFDGDLVRVSGHVMSATLKQFPVPHMDIRMVSAQLEVNVWVVGLTNVSPQSLVGSQVEVVGVAGVRANDRRQFSRVGLLSAKPEMLRVLSSASQLAATLPILSLSGLQNSTNGIVHTRGVVIEGGTNGFWLSDEYGGIRVNNPGHVPTSRGDLVTLLGVLLQPDGPERKLHLVRVMSATPGTFPVPAQISAADKLNPKRHGQIVQIEGEFLRRIPDDHGVILVLRDGEHSFLARIRYSDEKEMSSLMPGSWLQLTGMLRMTGIDADGHMVFRVVVAEPGHIKMLAPPPWSEVKARFAVNSLAVALGLGLLALTVIHRRLKDSARRLGETEAELLQLNADLEHRIRARTTELLTTNQQLLKEISERELAQITLDQSERKFRNMVERVHAVVWEFEWTDRRFIYVSPQAARLGYSMEDWLQPGFWPEHLHPDDREFAIAFCTAETNKGVNHEFQYRFMTADGGHVWFDERVTVETRADGTRLLRGVFIDITEQKQREEALRESEERFTRAFQASPAISAITSYPDGVLLDVNERLIQASGYAREELLGRTTLELGLWAEPSRHAEIIGRLERGESVREAEYTAVSKHGQRRTMLTSLERIVIRGKPCLLSINQDITDRKRAEHSLRESEERFAKAFHASSVIIVITRLMDDCYIDVNERFTQALGYSREEVIGKSSLELGIWLDPAKREEIVAALERGSAVRNVECVFRAKSGSQHTMLTSLEKIVLGGEACLLGINQDITDRKKAERLRDEQNRVLEMIAQGASLEQTLERLTLAIEAQAEETLCSVLLLDPDGRHLRHGAAPSLPADYNRLIDGFPIGPSAGSCGTAVHRGETVIVEDILTDPLWAEIRHLVTPYGLRSCWSTPIFDAQQRMLGTFAIYARKPGGPPMEHQQLIQTATHTAAICIKRARDEESLQATQRTLRERNDLLSEMEQLAQIGAWSMDLATNELKWSDEVYRISEVARDFKPDLRRGLEFYPPEARLVISTAIDEGLRYGTAFDLELPFVTANGRRRWVRSQGQVEFDGTRPVRLHGAFQDITSRRRTEEALRESEERFAKAFQLSPTITVIMRRSDGRYLDVNERFTKIMGYAREEVLGKTALDLSFWANPEKRAEILATIEKEGFVRDVECEYVDRLQRRHTMLTSVEPILIGGEPCLLSVNYEITERKQAEAIRANLEVQLRQSQKMEAIGTLAGGIAHDFNNILGTIIGFAELAKMEAASSVAILSNLDDLLKASHRAKDLVRQILAFSRREDFQRKIVPLDPVIKESVRLLRAGLPATILLRTSIIEPLPPVLADATLVQQVIMNLATNAAQAIGHRPGEVGILVREHTENAAPGVPGSGLRPGSHVMIQVRDNGCGMEPYIVERIFEPFFTTKGPGQGTGLGLSVVHGIVTAHEGVIRVESVPGQGSTFTILLPSAEARPPAPATTTKLLPPSRGSERILLVDDEVSLLAVGEKLLRRTGYHVRPCSSPEQALETFRQAPSEFDLVITDYSMPSQSGADLARELLQVRSDIQIIVCTGYTARMTREEALQMGFCDFLQKPVEFDALCRAVRGALDRTPATNGHS